MLRSSAFLALPNIAPRVCLPYVKTGQYPVGAAPCGKPERTGERLKLAPDRQGQLNQLPLRL